MLPDRGIFIDGEEITRIGVGHTARFLQCLTDKECVFRLTAETQLQTYGLQRCGGIVRIRQVCLAHHLIGFVILAER